MSSVKNYSAIDRLVHHVAFSAPFIQKVLRDLEEDLFKRRLQGVESDGEVFVTGLPRAGTTLVLDLLYRTGEFATFTYRHMPFILSPLIWKRLSRPFQKRAEVMERAHGDGVEVSFDSPEAFEEIIWLFYMRSRIVGSDRLATLSSGDETEELADAIRSTVRKLLMDQAEEAGSGLRYLSKNNANISRLGVIGKIFPGATIVVPFRNPLAHAGSLLKQHLQFASQHRSDRFSSRYMAWLGHYDFGENFKPIDFDGWLETGDIGDPSDPAFWVRYWTAAYRHVLDHGAEARICLLDYDDLLLRPEDGLRRLAERLDLRQPDALIGSAGRIRAPTSQPVDPPACPADVLEACAEVHQALRAKAGTTS